MQNSLLCRDVITVERFNLEFTYEEFWGTGFTPTTPCCSVKVGAVFPHSVLISLLEKFSIVAY